MSAKVSGMTTCVEVTPTLDTNAHAADDQLTDVMTIDTGMIDCGKWTAVTIQDITIVDQAKQSAETVIFFFDASPTVASSKNAALDITDAEMTSKCQGYATVTSYEDLSGSSVGVARNVGLTVKIKTQNGNGKFYAVAKTNGTPTYAASSLTFKFKLLVDL